MKSFPTYRHADGSHYSLPYHLPEGQSNGLKIKVEVHGTGKRLPLISIRNAIFMGLTPTQLVLDRPMGVHKLICEDRGVWMSSMPQEIEQHHRQLARARGHVLVGGLGLGVAVCILQKNRKVKSITVVEKSDDVRKLVLPWLPKGGDILSGDRFIQALKDPAQLDSNWR